MNHKKVLLAWLLLLSAPCVVTASDLPWTATPVPMGPEGREALDDLLGAEDQSTAEGVLQQVLALPPGEALMVLEVCLRRDSQIHVLAAVVNILANDLRCPIGRSLADALLLKLSAVCQEGVDAQVSQHWSVAMARMGSGEVRDVLCSWSRSEWLPESQRVVCISALSMMRQVVALDTLLALSDNEDVVGTSAREALRDLLLLEDVPNKSLRQELRVKLENGMGDFELSQTIQQQLNLRVSKHQGAEVVWRQRVVDLEKQIYGMLTQPEQRVAHLLRMFDDSHEALRLAALDLLEASLQQGEVIPDALRFQVRRVQEDESAKVRLRATRLLRVLGDEIGARQAAKRLVEGKESDVEVCGAMIRLLARVPQESALDTLVRMLDSDVYQEDAANAILGAMDAGKWNAKRNVRFSKDMTARLSGLSEPPPVCVLLLGRCLVAGDRRWSMVRHWLSSRESALQMAAAHAWVQSSEPLEPLLAVVRPVYGEVATPLEMLALQALGERGRRLEEGRWMVAQSFWKDASVRQESYIVALVGWAGRAKFADLAVVVRELDSASAPDRLRERVLNRVLERKDFSAGMQPQRAEWMLSRMRLRERVGDQEGARLDRDVLLSDQGGLADAGRVALLMEDWVSAIASNAPAQNAAALLVALVSEKSSEDWQQLVFAAIESDLKERVRVDEQKGLALLADIEKQLPDTHLYLPRMRALRDALAPLPVLPQPGENPPEDGQGFAKDSPPAL